MLASLLILAVALQVNALVYSYRSPAFLKKNSQSNSFKSTAADDIIDVSAPEKLRPKVPSTAWRWPPIWPFPPDFLEDTIVTGQGENSRASFPKEAFAKHISDYTEPNVAYLEISSKDNKILSTTSSLSQFIDIEENYAQDYYLSYETESFDSVVVSFGVEYFSDPKGFFREVWRVLRPGGICFICFSKLQESKLTARKMWSTMTNEQKIWIAGSYYHYSAGSGWTNIEGYDLLGTTGGGAMVFENTTDIDAVAFVVQATKSDDLESIDLSTNSSQFIAARLAGIKNLEKDDKEFLSLRLAAEYSRADDDAAKAKILNSDTTMLQIYSVLKDVKELVVPYPIKALLAVVLASKWTNSPAQVVALRRGLGLEANMSDPFWLSLGKATASLGPRDRILVLGDVVPLFGTPKEVLLAYAPTAIEEITTILKTRFPQELDADIVRVATDLVIGDYLLIEGLESSPIERISWVLSRVLTFANQLSLEQFNVIATETKV